MLRRCVLWFIMAGLLGCSFSACKHQKDNNTITVGVLSGPETALMQIAKTIGHDCYGLNIKIVTFTDYHIPNAALHDGSLDANVFQHQPFLDAVIKARGYDLTTVGKTFIYPMAIYSKQYSHIHAVPDGARIAIPNDPTNEARALLLLQHAGLIQLKSGTNNSLAMPKDIESNPHHFQFIALDAAQLPRALSQVDMGVINTNFAIPAGLHPSTALYSETKDSLYANIIVTRTADKNATHIQKLIAALHSPAVIREAKRIFQDAAIPAWDVHTPVMPCQMQSADKKSGVITIE